MVSLFDRFSRNVERVEMIARQLGLHNERILCDDLRNRLIDEMVEDAIEFRHPKEMLTDVMKNGCVGYVFFTDLTLIGVLHDDLLLHGPDCTDDLCPIVMEEVIQALFTKECKMLQDDG